MASQVSDCKETPKIPIYCVVEHFCSLGILMYGLARKNTLLLGVYAYLYIKIFA